MMQVGGADVWKGRWVVVVLVDGRFDSAFVAPTLSDAVNRLPEAAAIGVDMPIGLPGLGERRPSDLLARAYVGPRRSSVFLTPPQEMVEAESLAEANRLAPSGRGRISAQAFALRRAILEVQALAEIDGRLYEVHPEVSFVCANGGDHLAWPKTCWNGVEKRRQILRRSGIDMPDDLGVAGVAGVADVLDAGIVAWSAHRIGSGRGESVPPGVGQRGAIWR